MFSGSVLRDSRESEPYRCVSAPQNMGSRIGLPAASVCRWLAVWSTLSSVLIWASPRLLCISSSGIVPFLHLPQTPPFLSLFCFLLGQVKHFAEPKKKNHSRESWHDQYHAVTQGELGETRSGDQTWTTTGWVGVSFSVELPGMRCAE